MDYRGLLAKFPVNRYLTPDECKDHLDQKTRLEQKPLDQLCVIKINSTYLESVDKFFAIKGFATLLSLIAGSIIFTGYYIAFKALFFDRWESHFQYRIGTVVWLSLFMLLLFGPMLFVSIRAFFKESFSWTHYPIRLNRKTKMIHVFRTNGTVLSVPWDEVYFTLYFGKATLGNLVGHVMDKNVDPSHGAKVLETFAFSNVSTDKDILRGHWEFLRRYMEEGPETVYEGIKFCMPVDGKYESFGHGMETLFAEMNDYPDIGKLINWPIAFVQSFTRFFAMRTSRIPKWPKEVEDACIVESGDPYIKDYRINPKDLQ